MTADDDNASYGGSGACVNDCDNCVGSEKSVGYGRMDDVKRGGNREVTRLGSSNIYNLKIVLPTTLLPATTWYR